MCFQSFYCLKLTGTDRQTGRRTDKPMYWEAVPPKTFNQQSCCPQNGKIKLWGCPQNRGMNNRDSNVVVLRLTKWNLFLISGDVLRTLFLISEDVLRVN